MSRLVQSAFAWGLLGCLVVLPGCGDAVVKPKTFPVTGTVVYKGDPVANVKVMFMTDGAPRTANGVTDDQGKFKLSTFDVNDGALPGEHKIVVIKETANAAPKTVDTSMLDDPSKMASQYNDDMKKKESEEKKMSSLLPLKYASLETTPLKETVTEAGPNQFVLTLSD